MRSLSRAGAVAIAVAGLLAVPPAAGWARTPPAPAVVAPTVAGTTVPALRAQLRAGTLAASRGVVDLCATHHLACRAEAVTVAKGSKQVLTSTEPIGYGATDLERAYGLAGAPGGSGTIAVIEAGSYPTLEADLRVYRGTYGLPACTSASGCLRQVKYTGGPAYAPSSDPYTSYVEELTATETALDVDMASAACPRCTILEIQVPALDATAADAGSIDLAAAHFATASQTAVRLGAKAISISFGFVPDAITDHGTPARQMAHNGVAVVVADGDSGPNIHGSYWPSNLTTVIAAGGTSLYVDRTSSRGFTETAWNGAGSGCSADLGPAYGQPTSVASACAGHRADSDLSSVADPYTGVAIYDSYAPSSGLPLGFAVFGGTSASAPFLAGMYLRAGVHGGVLGPNQIYRAAPSRFNDVVIGATGPSGYCASVALDDRLCVAGPGWDGPTGRGTPKGLVSFRTTG